MCNYFLFVYTSLIIKQVMAELMTNLHLAPLLHFLVWKIVWISYLKIETNKVLSFLSIYVLGLNLKKQNY